MSVFNQLALTRACLHCAAARLVRLLARARGQAADDRRGDQEDHERRDVARVRDRQVVARLDEEVVEREDRDHGGCERRQLAPADRDQEDGEQIDDSETSDRRHRVECGHGQCRRGERGHDLDGRSNVRAHVFESKTGLNPRASPRAPP